MIFDIIVQMITGLNSSILALSPYLFANLAEISSHHVIIRPFTIHRPLMIVTFANLRRSLLLVIL